MRTMNRSRECVERLLEGYVADHPSWRRLAAEAPEVHQALREALLGPGKRLRPRLFLLAAEGYGRVPLPALAPAVISLELAHTFVLAHDDLLDHSVFRRGGPVLHARLDLLFRGSPPDGFTGKGTALVAGDWLYTLALDSLLDLPVGEGFRLRALRLFTGSALATARGALREMEAARLPLHRLSFETLSEISRLKTSAYSFQLPLKLAALLAGRKDGEEGGSLEPFSDRAGEAFQWINDHESLVPWLRGGPAPDDIRDRRRTPALLYVWRRTDPGERPVLTSGNHEAMRKLFLRTRVLAWLEDRIRERIDDALGFLPLPGMNGRATGSLKTLLQALPGGTPRSCQDVDGDRAG